MNKLRMSLAAASTAFALAAPVRAAVNPEEAAQLGRNLTPWGAEKAASADGSIAEYSGPPKPPTGYNAKRPGVRPDPYVGEKPLYSVTAQNMDKYAVRLSEGTKAMLKKYPSFRVDVYPSHRTATFPKYVIDNTLRNATECKTSANELQLQGCYGGVPFPIPKTGSQAVWNHLLHYNAPSFGASYRTYVVDAAGNRVLQLETDSWQEFPIYDPKRSGTFAPAEIFWKYRGDTTGPARKAGEKWLLLASVDGVNVGQRVWQYVPGQRRVKLAPDVAYDTPNPQLGGVATMDETDLFLGTMDRYDFSLAGKRETLMPYNNFKLTDASVCPDAVALTPHHVNPDCLRWELHRTWAVNLILKPGFRHVFPKRTLYLDEDWTGAGVAESYDASGKLYRAEAVVFYPMYETQGQASSTNFTFDLGTGAWAYNVNPTETGGTHEIPVQGARMYTPDALAGGGIR